MHRFGWPLIAAMAMMTSAAFAQAGDAVPPAEAGASAQPAQGVSPREAWRRYMMQAGPRGHGDGVREAERRDDGRRARRGRRGPGMMMARPAQGPATTTFYFNPRQGSVYIRCAPSEPAEACAKAFAPIIEALSRQNAAGGTDAR
jgi:hypothetical protein